jgi:hypothetical protein
MTLNRFISGTLPWGAVFLVLYLSWSLARWLDPNETVDEFLSAGGIIVALECLIGLSLLILTIAWFFRAAIRRILKQWRERS